MPLRVPGRSEFQGSPWDVQTLEFCKIPAAYRIQEPEQRICRYCQHPECQHPGSCCRNIVFPVNYQYPSFTDEHELGVNWDSSSSPTRTQLRAPASPVMPLTAP